MKLQELNDLLDNPTISVPEAGAALGLSRNGAYDAANRGDIPTIKVLSRKRVPTKWLREKLVGGV